MKKTLPDKLEWRDCCANPRCKMAHPVNFGTFAEGTGFEPWERKLLDLMVERMAPRRNRIRWTQEELEVVRTYWPRGGQALCAEMLPHRPAASIRQIAFKQGVKRLYE